MIQDAAVEDCYGEALTPACLTSLTRSLLALAVSSDPFKSDDASLRASAHLDEQRVLVTQLTLVAPKLSDINLSVYVTRRLLEFHHQVILGGASSVNDDVRENCLGLRILAVGMEV